MIGLLLLMGIVKKNSIILVDYANAYRDKGFDARESMKRAGPIRLRPILMTATATLMAAIPPALGLGPGSEIRMPMAIAVIGGLVLSTILSLVVVPSFYVIADKVFKRKRRPVEEAEKGEIVPEVAPGPIPIRNGDVPQGATLSMAEEDKRTKAPGLNIQQIPTDAIYC